MFFFPPHKILPNISICITHKIMQKQLFSFLSSFFYSIIHMWTPWISKPILRINGNTFSGAHGTSFRMSVMRKCKERQLTFKSRAFLIGNGHGCVALYDLAQCKYLTRSSLNCMNVKEAIGFHVWEGKVAQHPALVVQILGERKLREILSSFVFGEVLQFW